MAVDGFRSLNVNIGVVVKGGSRLHFHGAEKAEHSPPTRRMMEINLPLGGGNDAMRVASYNSWATLYWLLTGRRGKRA